MTSELQRWARAELDLAEARSATSVAEMRPAEIMEWAEQNRRKPAAHKLGPARLEVVRLVREQSYAALQGPVDDRRPWTAAQWDPIVRARAEAILDTPVDELAAMVTMTDTVMGNWRTIAATVTQRPARLADVTEEEVQDELAAW